MVRLNNKYISLIILLALSLTAAAQGSDTNAGSPKIKTPHNTVARPEMHALVTTKIRLLTRTYGDSIVLRWVAEDYASYKYLCDFGVNILRVRRDGQPGLHIDTLAYGLKPLSLERFRAKYPDTDSLALIPQGLLYGDAHNYKEEPQGSMGRTLEDNSEQDIAFAFTMVVAEWRKDLAEDMAARFTDRDVTPGATYDYYIQPTLWDNGGRLIFEPGVAEGVVNNRFSPQPFNPQMTDSLSGPNHIIVGWWDREHSSYEIERRMVSTLDGTSVNGRWQRINDKPYLSMVEQPEKEDYRLIGDSVPDLGIYEYRIMGYDAFADLSEPSPARRVVVRDIQPPTAPILKYVVLERPDDSDPMARVIAHIVWEKPAMEKDLEGYCIHYNSPKVTGKEWQLLNNEMIPPSDTLYSVDMTGKITGFIYVSAYDKTGNESRSLVQQIALRDYKAPDAPDSLRVNIQLPQGDSLTVKQSKWAYAILKWNACPDDDIDYYDIAYANDTTHTFIIRNQGGIRDTEFIDSLALDVNQDYIYYQVRAVDYSTNIGPWSPWLQVQRPHVSPPSLPHLDTSAHSDADGMHMEWIVGMDVDMRYHVAYRRLGEDGQWEVIGRYEQDSLKNTGYRITIDDNPPYNRDKRYYYYVESHNSSPFTGDGLAVSWYHRGPKVWKVDLRLIGDYFRDKQQTKLAWETGKLPLDGDYYYCIYRKGQGEKKFSFVVSVPKTDLTYTDQLLRKGEQAEYYIMIQWRDGRQSNPSNTITVKRGDE